MPDAAVDRSEGPAWLIEVVQGHFTLMGVGETQLPEIPGLSTITVGPPNSGADLIDTEGFVARRYGVGAYLFRPDGHVCAAFDKPDRQCVERAMDRANGMSE